MNDQRSHARAWLAKAVNDLTAAQRLLALDGPYDAVCFHAQQAAEKALKALLAYVNAPIPRSHNLEDLQAQYRAAAPAPSASLAVWDLTVLTPFAVELRYDLEFSPDRQQADGASVLAAAVIEAAAAIIAEGGSSTIATV